MGYLFALFNCRTSFYNVPRKKAMARQKRMGFLEVQERFSPEEA